MSAHVATRGEGEPMSKRIARGRGNAARLLITISLVALGACGDDDNKRSNATPTLAPTVAATSTIAPAPTNTPTRPPTATHTETAMPEPSPTDTPANTLT